MSLRARIEEIKADLGKGVITREEAEDAAATAAQTANPQAYDHFRRVQEAQNANVRPASDGIPPAPAVPNSGLLARQPSAMPRQPQQMPQQQQPMAQPQEQPGLLSRAGDALSKFGSSMSQKTGELFNDPNRMAMLQGGLSMMDPNTYYDKQGFGSVFTGLNKGLGAAQSGMKGVMDRRASKQQTALQKAQAHKAMNPPKQNPVAVQVGENQLQTYQGGSPVGGPFSKGYAPKKQSNPTAVPVGNNKMQMYQDGKPLGDIFEKGYAPKSAKVAKYKTIMENTEDGGQVRVNYKINADGTKTEQSRSDITRLVSGITPAGELAVQEHNSTTGKLTPLVVKETGLDPEGMKLAITLLNEVNEWENLLKANPKLASEFPGKGADLANWLSESLNMGTPYKGRADIKNTLKQLTPLLTPQYIDEARISDTERVIAKAALGFTEWSTGMDKQRALPTIRRLLRLRAGLEVKGGVAPAKPSGGASGKYVPGQNNHLFGGK